MATGLASWVIALGLCVTAPGSSPDPTPNADSEPEVPRSEPKVPTTEPSTLHPPELLESATAERPQERESEEVEVLMRLRIDPRGAVSHVEVLDSGGPTFDEAASAAARSFRFSPAREGTRPIEVEIEFRYVFPVVPVEPDPEPEPESEPEIIDDTEVVLAPRIEREAAQLELSAERGGELPGAQGDALKATQTLAGVARPPAGRGELSVWGASPSDSRRTIDGIPVPRLFHLGGTRSVLPTEGLDSVALVPGGFGPHRGRAIGGHIRARTRDARPVTDPHRVGGYARVDPLDAGAAIDARVHEHGWLSLALRRSLLAWTYGALAPASAQQLVPLPDYWDYQGKGVIEPSSRDELTISSFGAHDRVERGIPSLTPDTAFTERRRSAFHRVGLQLRRRHDRGRSVLLRAWVGRDDDRWAQRFASDRAVSNHRAWRGGLRLEERRRLARLVALRWGLDTELGHHALEREGAVTLPAREGDVIVFGQPPGDRVGRDTWVVTQVGLAAYSSLRFELAEGRWTLEPGLRVEPMVTVGERLFPVRPIEPELGHTDVTIAIDPRLRLEWSPRPALSLFTAGGRYHQAADPRDLSPVFGNPLLTPARAYHALLGARTEPLRWLELVVTGFWIRSSARAGRSPEPTPPVATLLLSEGEGRSAGASLTARVHPTESLRAAIAYTFMRSERRDPGRSGWRPFDLDQPHGLQAIAGWTHQSGVELGGRLALASGHPRTEVVSAVPNGRTGGFEPIFGQHNATRLPLTLALSLRVGWSRTFSWGSLSTWLDVLNATNRRNVEEVFYASDFSTRGAVTGLPVLPSLGLRIRR